MLSPRVSERDHVRVARRQEGLRAERTESPT